MSDTRVAVVTGANRGIGLESAKQLAERGLTVILTGRDPARADQAAAALGGNVLSHQLDVTDRQSIERLASFLGERFGRLDVLVNNAGVVRERYAAGVFDTAPEVLRETFETNTLGAYQCCQLLVPLMLDGGYGRVVNVSSGMGQLSEMGPKMPGYRMSKAALNALTRLFARELEGTGVKVNAVCPGWVSTALGGPEAPRPVEDSVDTIVWLATLRDDGPSGGFFRDCKAIAW
jgi:NAD(P)-dependent dehydrogenase (short-subunit alcohol dehydrogenase family)